MSLLKYSFPMQGHSKPKLIKAIESSDYLKPLFVSYSVRKKTVKEITFLFVIVYYEPNSEPDLPFMLYILGFLEASLQLTCTCQS